MQVTVVLPSSWPRRWLGTGNLTPNWRDRLPVVPRRSPGSTTRRGQELANSSGGGETTGAAGIAVGSDWIRANGRVNCRACRRERSAEILLVCGGTPRRNGYCDIIGHYHVQ